MAGLPWFELDTDFADGPKIAALCSRLREPLADAYVARIYAYCYRHARDRFDVGVASDTIEGAARWRGRRGVLFDALMAVGILERDNSKTIVHGVEERLGPHLSKRISDAIRQREHRDKVAKSVGRNGSVTRDVTCDVTRESRGNTDKDKDKDKAIPIIIQPSVVGLAGESAALLSFRQNLSGALGLSGLIAVAKPHEAEATAAYFESQLALVGEAFLIRDCLEAADKAGVTPGSLKWLRGWVEKLHTPKQARS
jgi:hypothetical protein